MKVDDFARHSRWTEPGPLGRHLDPLSPDPAALSALVGGLILHPLFAAARGIGGGTGDPFRSVPEIVTALFARDPRPLSEPREPGARVIGTCANYALLACAILRQHRVPARVRVGFAGYFNPEFWEDHWVCEVHDGTGWRLLDAELTPEVCRHFGIDFDPADIPRDRFLVAADAWRAMRQGEHAAGRFGVSAFGLSGLRFAAGTLLRDLAALDKEELLPFDYWGPARDFRPGEPIPPDWLDRLDRLAGALTAGDDAEAILTAHPWAALTASILSFPHGAPVEISLDRW